MEKDPLSLIVAAQLAQQGPDVLDGVRRPELLADLESVPNHQGRSGPLTLSGGEGGLQRLRTGRESGLQPIGSGGNVWEKFGKYFVCDLRTFSPPIIQFLCPFLRFVNMIWNQTVK